MLRSTQDPGVIEVGLGYKVAHEMAYLLPNHSDPADRFLAATAIAYDLVLVSADQKRMGVGGLNVFANL